jgi:hypothetical protein
MKITIKTSEIDFCFEDERLGSWDYENKHDRGQLEIISALIQKVVQETIKIKQA